MAHSNELKQLQVKYFSLNRTFYLNLNIAIVFCGVKNTIYVI